MTRRPATDHWPGATSLVHNSQPRLGASHYLQ
jgi:hypothetical protein